MKITRNLTTIEFSDSDHDNLWNVLTLFDDLKGNLEEHGDETIRTIDGRSLDIDELDDIVYYLKFFTDMRKFVIE